MGNPLRAGGGTTAYKSSDRVATGSSRKNGRNPIVLAFQTLLEHVSDGVLITDPSGRRLYSNPALDDLLGQDGRSPGIVGPPNWIPTDQHERYSAYLTEFAGGKLNGGMVTLEWEVIHAAGDRRPVAMKLVPMRDMDGRLSALFWLVIPTASNDESKRLDDLESCVRKIANELDRVGLVRTATAPPDYSKVPGLKNLSRREWEVLDRLLEGHRVSSISDILCVSEHTVRNHLKSIFKKVNVHSQVELIEKLRSIG